MPKNTTEQIQDWWDDSDLGQRESLLKGKQYWLGNSDYEVWFDSLSDEIQNLLIDFLKDVDLPTTKL